MFMKTSKRYLAVLFAVITALLVLSSCSSEGSEIPAGTLEATNDAVDFVFYYPDSWQVFTNEGMIAIKPAPSSTGIVNTSISVSAYELASEDSAMGVNEYWDRYNGTLETTFGEFELTKESELTVDGIPAARKEYKGKLTDSVYKFVQVFCIRNGTVYQITFTASEEDYDSYVSAVDTVTGNFRFK